MEVDSPCLRVAEPEPVHEVREEYIEQRDGHRNKDIMQDLGDLFNGYLLEFASKMRTQPNALVCRETQQQSSTMHSWAVHNQAIIKDHHMQTTMDRLEEVLLASHPRTVLREKLTRALNDLGQLPHQTLQVRQDRIKEPFEIEKDDICLLYCCASEAEQLCLTLSHMWSTATEIDAFDALEKHCWAPRMSVEGRLPEDWAESAGFKALYEWKRPNANCAPSDMGNMYR